MNDRRLLVVAWEYPGVHSKRGAALARRVGQLSSGFAAHGWRVDVMHRQHGPLHAPTVSNPVQLHPIIGPQIDPTEGIKIARRVATAWFAIRYGDRSGRWAKIAKDSLSMFDSAPPTLVIGCFTPRGPLAVARQAARRWGVPWLADLQDPVREGSSHWIRPLVERWMRHTLAEADTVIQVSPEWAVEDATLLQREVVSLRHGVPFGAATAHEGHRSSHDGFIILYAGSVSERNQSPRPLMEAIARLNAQPEPRVVLQIAGRAEVVDIFYRAAPNALAREAIRALGWLAEEELDAAMASADCLVLIPSIEPGRPVVPSKLFHYIGTHRPILVAGSDSGGMASLYSEWGHRNVTQASSAAIATALEHAFVEDHSALLSLESCARPPLSEKALVDAYIDIAERALIRRRRPRRRD